MASSAVAVDVLGDADSPARPQQIRTNGSSNAKSPAASSPLSPSRGCSSLFAALDSASIRAHIQHVGRAYQRVPLRTYLRHMVEDSPLGYVLDVVSVVLSLIAVTSYIYSTYTAESVAMMVLELVIASFFLLEYSFRLYIARSRAAYIFSFTSLVDVLTILPPFLQLAADAWLANTSPMSYTFNFLRFVRVMKIFRVLQLSRLIKHSENEVSRALAVMAFTLVAIIFCSAGFFMEIETDPENGNAPMYSFDESIYWSTVTTSTLGYGEIVPTKDLGRWLVIVMMVLMFTIIPYQTNKVIELIANGNKYLTKSYRRKKKRMHVVILGHITSDGMLDMIHELYQEDHGYADNDIVFLADRPPDRAIQMLLLTHRRADQLQYLEGRLKDPKDLGRAKVHSAQMVFIIADRNAVNPSEEDTNNIMNTLAIDKFVQDKCRSARGPPSGGTSNRCLVQLLLPKSRQHLISSIRARTDENRVPHSISMICLGDLKAQMMGLSALNCPGLSTLLLNLSRTVKHHLPVGMEAQPWHYEYWWGAGMEVYRSPVSPFFQGMTFKQVADIVYRDLKILVIGVEVQRPRPTATRTGSPTRTAPAAQLAPGALQRHLLMAPMDLIITDVARTHVFIISNELRPALKVASYGLKDREGRDSPAKRKPGSTRSSSTDCDPRVAAAAKHLSQLSRQTARTSAEASREVILSLESSFSRAAPAVRSPVMGSPVASRHRTASIAPPRQRQLSGLQPATPAAAATRLQRLAEPQPATGMGRLRAWLRPASAGGDVLQPYQARGVSAKHIFLADAPAEDFDDEDDDAMEVPNFASSPRAQPSGRAHPPGVPGDADFLTSRTGRRILKRATYSLSTMLASTELMPASDAEEDDDDATRAAAATRLRRRRILQLAYHMRPEGAWSIQASTLEQVTFAGHVVIMGWNYPSIVSLIATLRRRYLKRLRPIVVVDSKRPLENWETVSVFQAVYFMAGQSHDHDALIRANAGRAHRVIIQPEDVEEAGSTAGAGRDSRRDTLVVFTYQHLRCMAPKVPILTELTSGANQAFLSGNSPLYGSSLDHQQLASSYAAGAVFLPSMLEAMCCQAFFNPDIIRILRLILYAHEADYNQVQEEEDWMDAQEKASPLGAEGPAPAGGLHSTSEPEGIASPISKAEAMRSCAIVTQIPIGDEFIGKEYGEFVLEMMSRRGMICMGLYRRETHEVLGNRMPYVYTNPPHEAAINNGDLAFVMCSYMPEDSCMQTDSNSQGLLLHGQEVVTKRQKGSLVRCSSSKTSMLQGDWSARSSHALDRSLTMNASPTDTLGRRSEPLRAAKRSSILSVGSKHDRLSDSGDLRAPRPEDGPLGVDNSAIFGDEVSPAKGARESGVDMPEVLRALSESQQTLQASLMEGMQGLYDDMRRDIAEVRRELHEVRQAQKHLRHARSGAM